MKNRFAVTDRCKYWKICKYSDAQQCPNVPIGCILLTPKNKAEAEKLR